MTAPLATPSSQRATLAAYPLASLLFFASGCTGLVYEVLWFKQFAHVWGSSTLATAAVVGSFLLGLGLGAHVIGRVADRVPTPLRWYGAFELAIGVLALVIPLELGLLRSVSGALYPALSEHPLGNYAARLGLTFLVIGPPTILMGGTLPLMVRQFAPVAAGLRYSTGWLYAVNTLGAATGCYVCGFHLLGSLGVTWTNAVTAGANLAIGAVALYLSRRLAPEAAEPARKSQKTARPASPAAEDAPLSCLAARSPLLLAIVAVLTGFSALVLQIVWVRQLVLILGGTTYAFTATLFVVLVGIGLGSLLFRMWARTERRLELLPLLTLPVLLGATVLGQYLIVPLTSWVARIRYDRADPLTNALVCATVSAALEFVPAVVMGLVFPYLVHLTRRSAERAGEAVGRIYALNTAGTILGATLTSALLIPAAGGPGAVKLALAGYAVALFFLFPLARPTSIAIAGLTGCLALAFAWFGVPRHDPRFTNAGGYAYGLDQLNLVAREDELLSFEEGRLASVLVTRGAGDVYLRVDGKVDATSGGDMVTQLGLAYYPRFLRPAAKSVCVIGYGSGSTAGASVLFADTSVTCCEIEPAVYATSSFFSDVNHDPPSRPGFRMVFDDGRNFLQGAQERFDLIISEPSNPWMPGIANLFTQECYQRMRSRLAPGGMVAQWIQVYDFSLREYALIARTIGAVFPHFALIRVHDRDTILLASDQPIAPSAELALAAQSLVDVTPAVQEDLKRYFTSADVRTLLLERWFLDRAGLERLVARDRSGGGINTDTNLRLEFDAPLRLFVPHTTAVPEVDLELVAAATPEWFKELFTSLAAGPAQIDGLLTPFTALRDQGHVEAALALLEFAQNIAPEAPAWRAESLAHAILKAGRPSPQDLASIDLLPPDAVARVARRLAQAQSHDGAVTVYRRLVARAPGVWQHWAGLGLSLQALRRWQEADEAFGRALQIDASAPELGEIVRQFIAQKMMAGQ